MLATTLWWPHPLPFMSDLALKRGYELPLPFGVSGVFFYVERDVEISNVRLGINGAPLRDVNNFIDLGARSRSSGGIARFDAGCCHSSMCTDSSAT